MSLPLLEPERLRTQIREYDAFADHFLLPQDFDLAENTPVARPTSEDLDAMQNNDLFEGDILGIAGVDDAQFMDPEGSRNKRASFPTIRHSISTIPSRDQGLETTHMGNSMSLKEDLSSIFNRPYHSSLNTGTYPDKLWSEGRVPYMLEEGMTESQRAAIAQAFDEYKEKTCIRFVPRQESNHDYIFIKRNVAFGCSSYVGRAGGNQTVSLEVGKCFSKGIIAHELMHAIDPLAMPYDYESVMHYHKLAFSKNGRPTIVPRDENAEIGQRYKLSQVDAKKVNKLYKCEADWELVRPKTTSTVQPTTPDVDLGYGSSSSSSTPEITTSTSSPKSTSDRWPIAPHRLITLSIFSFKSLLTSTTTSTPAPTTSTSPDEEEEEEESRTTRWTHIPGKVVGETSDKCANLNATARCGKDWDIWTDQLGKEDLVSLLLLLLFQSLLSIRKRSPLAQIKTISAATGRGLESVEVNLNL
uniref:Metalloendopeptidase n=1 Tax=Ditylenchus dipsaci TaxID=166011 RepID=A0A915E889_9BILA